MSNQERFAELWTDYLEGELDESGVAELRELLSADKELLQLAADMYQTHRLLGLVIEEIPSRQNDFVRAVMSGLPEDSDSFVNSVMADVARTNDPTVAAPSSVEPHRTRWRTALLAGVALLIVAIASYSFWPMGHKDVVKDEAPQNGETTTEVGVRIVSMAHAKFFGELLPPVNSVLSPKRDYVLMSGMVEVVFPAGASAIIEGPAVFRVLSDESLALDVGRCSVHAPDGAEGFRVETPVTQVVDRGTRFTVRVAETSETEVQVIEGAADVYDASRIRNPPNDEIRLTNGKARRFANGRAFAADSIPFDPSAYRRGLPDRIISYHTTKAADGGAENLVSVTIQRNGRVVEIPVEELTPTRVTAFKATSSGAYLCGGESIPGKRIATLSDRSLVTGVINPGGSVKPLSSDPVLSGESATPGLAIRFDKPVTNGPGADVVFFDLQTFSNPPDGDAFHVSPLEFRDGLKSHTIRIYDLTMESPSARDLTNFYVHMFSSPADSLGTLESLECAPHKQVIKFRGLAVGIDLSDLGYAPGETVEGLFFQDALDDQHFVDPVFIGGLPELR
ncbi:MAG: FecR domain-containing protein [Planctomycetaceae bacterium]|nr:FecR domain-containing protein [Planctomycetaceae bacterium]